MLLGKTPWRFDLLVRAHSADLYRYAYWLCRDRFLAEDLVQETFARAWKGWPRLRDERAAKGWLFKILHNEYARLFERRRGEIPGEAWDETLELESGDPGPEAGFSLRQALARLPAAYREPLLLQVLGGFSCAEIGELLATSESAVMTRLTRARQGLRKLIEPKPVPWKQVK